MAFHAVVGTLYFWYFPWTRQIEFTYFASPATYGLLTSRRFDLEWWTYSMTALQFFAMYWVGLTMRRFLVRWLKVAWNYVICPIEIALWVLTWAVEIWWLAANNEPNFPDDPANSYLACCTPEFYTTVGSCPNFASLHPECDPSINISELGTPWDMIFFFIITIVMIGIFIVYLVLTLQIMWLTDDLVKYGDPDAPIPKYQTPLSNALPTSAQYQTPGLDPTTATVQQPIGVNSLTSRATSWQVIQQRK